MSDAKPILMTAEDAETLRKLLTRLRLDQHGIGVTSYLASRRVYGGTGGGGSAPPGTIVAVRAKKVGGDAYPCTFTYDVWAASDTAMGAATRIGTGMTPEYPRSSAKEYGFTNSPGKTFSWGTAVYQSWVNPPSWKLLTVFGEQPLTTDCECS